MTTLYVREGSEFREAETNTILSQARTLISLNFRTGVQPLDQPERTADFLRMHLATRDYEVFGLLHLSTRHRLLAVEELFRGTIDGASVYPREVVKSVLAHRSAAVIIFHNHPAGSPEPSQADECLTKRLQAALATIDVRILDHLVIGEQIFSFSQHGMI